MKYAVKNVESKTNIADLFGPSISLLKHEGEVSSRTILHYFTVCSVPNIITKMQRKKSPKHRMVEMFHTGTPQSVR